MVAGQILPRLKALRRIPHLYDRLGIHYSYPLRKSIILIADISNSSELTLSPLPTPTVASLMNGYLRQMLEIAREGKAVFENWTGDGFVLSFCNSESQDFLATVLEIALKMQRRFDTLKNEWKDKKFTVNMLHNKIVIALGTVGQMTLQSGLSKERMIVGKIVSEAFLASQVLEREQNQIVVSQAFYDMLDKNKLRKMFDFTLLKPNIETSEKKYLKIQNKKFYIVKEKIIE